MDNSLKTLKNTRVQESWVTGFWIALLFSIFLITFHQRAAYNAPHQLCLVFLTNRGLVHPTLWQRWWEDAEGGGLGSQVVGILHANHNQTYENIFANTPYWLRPYIDPNPAVSEWGALTAAMYRSLEYALQQHRQATYFSFISDSSVPLKKASEVLGEIAGNPRSRFDVFCRNFFPKSAANLTEEEKDDDHDLSTSPYSTSPKHSQWISLTRAHAEILVKNRDLWVDRPFLYSRHCRGLYAASDEYWPGYALSRKLGQERFDREIAIHVLDNPVDMSSHHWIHWHAVEPQASILTIGNAPVTKPSHPKNFYELRSFFLRFLREKQGVWWMRKVQRQATVTHCLMTDIEYFSRAFSMWLAKAKWTERHIQSFPKSVSCSFESFMTGLLKLNSTTSIPTREVDQAFFNAEIFKDTSGKWYTNLSKGGGGGD